MSNPFVTGKAALKSALLFQQQKKSLPQSLIFFVTSRCNARCNFCLYYTQITNPVAKDKELSVTEVEAIAGMYGKLHYLGLSGGEPFVRKDLEPICQAFIDHCGTAVVDIPSNFYYTDTMVATMEPLVRKNPGVIFELQASFDQVGEAHDESRKVKNLYRTAIDSFRALSELRAKHVNLKLKINIVYLDRNRDDVNWIVTELSKEISADRVQLTYPHDLLPSDGPLESEAVLEVDKYADLANRMASRSVSPTDLHTMGILALKRSYHRLLREAVANKRNVGSYCEAGRYILVIDEKGEVFPCEPLWHSIGNLRDYGYDVKAVLAGDAYESFRDQFLGPGKCNCTWSCAIHSAISVTPKYLPVLTLNAARAMLDKMSAARS